MRISRSCVGGLALLSTVAAVIAVPVYAQEEPAVSADQLCNDIGRADRDLLQDIKDELKSWMLRDIELYNRIIKTEDDRDRLDLDVQQQAENALLIAGELERLTSERLTAEDRRFAESEDLIQVELANLEQECASIRQQREMVESTMLEITVAAAEIVRLEGLMAQVQRGEYDLDSWQGHEDVLNYPATHRASWLEGQIARLRARISSASSAVAAAHALRPSEYPTDADGVLGLLEYTEEQWAACQQRRAQLVSGLSQLQQDYDRHRAGVLSGEAEVLRGQGRAAAKLEEIRGRLAFGRGWRLGQTESILRDRELLRSSQAAFRRLWECATNRERELDGGGTGTTGGPDGETWLLEGTWSLCCDEQGNWWSAARGTFRVSIGATGEAFGRYWEESSAEPRGAITGFVRGGESHLLLEGVLPLRGRVRLNPDHTASGSGELSGEFGTCMDARGSWQSDRDD